MAKRDQNVVKDSFFRGNYQAAVASSIDNPERSWSMHDFGFIVGSLCFLGRSIEAETLFLAHGGRLSLEQRIQARFFLGLGFTRVSDYRKARHYFGTNRREGRGRISLVASFYVFQGMSFFRYFCGKWRLALRDAERAFEAALRAQFLYGRVLSSDLRGHLLVQTGEVHLGLRTLKDAQALSVQIGNRGVAQAIEISRVTYEAQFGLGGTKSIVRLKKHLKAVSEVQDTYSHSGLLLELARQDLLRGALEHASNMLDQAAQLIYSHQNRRQECTLNLRYAYLSYLRNEVPRALSYLQSAKRSLDTVVDHALKLSVLGLERKLVSGLGMNERMKQLGGEIERESAIYGGWINQKILARANKSSGVDDSPTKDPLGHLLDRVNRDPAGVLEPILESGYLGLLLELFPETRGRSCVCLGLNEASLIIFDSGGISKVDGLTPLLRTVLLQLNRGPASKAELIAAVWKYANYHPFQHDPVIYQAVTGLRRLLGDYASWLETTETGYRLKESVGFKSLAGSRAAAEESLAPQRRPTGVTESIHRFDLNHRQARFMYDLKSGEFVSVHEYKKRFGVSEITACRDLSILFRVGFVLRVGKARATRYALKELSS